MMIRLMRSATSVALRIVVFGALATLAVLGIGPHTGRYQVLTVLTGSMRPTAPPGAVVFDVPTPLSTLKVGDVITYQIPVDDHRVVTHRIVSIKDAGTNTPTVRTKGDANTGADPWQATLGGATAWKMRAAVPAAGFAIVWLRRPAIHRLTMHLAPALMAAVWIWMIWGRGTRRPVEAESDVAVAA